MTGQGWGRWQRGVVDPRWENSPDQKYIVFRRGQLAALMVPNMKARINDLEDIAIYDAVVIRTQDVTHLRRQHCAGGQDLGEC
jgi:hypothetical protein